MAHGSRRSRLVSRSRTARGGLLLWLAKQAMDPIALVMTRRMLLGIKARAERAARTESPALPGGETDTDDCVRPRQSLDRSEQSS
jgi:hypothetical protein